MFGRFGPFPSPPEPDGSPDPVGDESDGGAATVVATGVDVDVEAEAEAEAEAVVEVAVTTGSAGCAVPFELFMKRTLGGTAVRGFTLPDEPLTSRRTAEPNADLMANADEA